MLKQIQKALSSGQFCFYAIMLFHYFAKSADGFWWFYNDMAIQNDQNFD